MKNKIMIAIVLILATSFVFTGCPPAVEEVEEPGVPGPITIGTKNFTEQFVVGKLMALLLEDRGFDVTLKEGMSSMVMREAMEVGDIDLCMDYTGTLWLSYAEHAYEGETPEELYEKAKDYDAENDLIWLNPIWCNNTYALAVTREFSEKNGITTLSDLAEYVNENEGKVPFVTDFEFYARPDGILGLEVHYGFAFHPDYITTVLPGVTFEYLIRGDVDVCMVFGTDPIVVKHDWVVLEDDKYFFPPYDLCPYVKAEVLEKYPQLDDILNELINAFPQEPAAARAAMTELNAKVDIDKMEPEDAAREWLIEKGLIKG
jgi:osmoprotectant transport system substrate-binding protein